MHDRDNNLAIDPDGLLCQSRDPKSWNGTRCTRGIVGKGLFISFFIFLFLIRFLVHSDTGVLFLQPATYLNAVKFAGKFYYEGTVTDDGLCRLGWSTANAVLDLGIRF